MILDLNRLQCFVAVAEELHFGRAAARLFMTQPPLSRQIQLLEHSLGVQLLERTSRSVRLTSAGQAFLLDANRLLAQAEQAADTARRISKGESGRVTLGCTAVAGYELIPGLLEAVGKALPDIDVVLKEMVSVAQVEALTANTIDLGFVRPLFARHALESRLVGRDSLLVAMPPDHALAGQESINLADMEGRDFIMYSPKEGRYFHNLIIGLFGAAGVRPKYVQYIDQSHTILALVRAGLGLAIVPSSAREFRFRNVVFRPIAGNQVMSEIYMAWRPDQRNPALATFREFASRYFSNRETELAGRGTQIFKPVLD